MNILIQLQTHPQTRTTADTTTTATTKLTTTERSKLFKFLDQPSKIYSFELPVTLFIFSNKLLQLNYFLSLKR